MSERPIELTYESEPSALAFMARAMLVPSWARRGDAMPPLSAKWSGHRVAEEPLESFRALTGLGDNPCWPLLYPLVRAFRLQMVVLTHPRFPYPIWSALQIRNRVVLHRGFDPDAVLDFHVAIHARRGLERGVEVDLTTTARTAGALAWECVSTFYYRGVRAGRDEAFAVAAAPTVTGPVEARWSAPTGARWRFGELTGDYNGIHLWGRYARLFGFRDAFLHPQRVLGECIAHLAPARASTPMRLEAWLKGPVYYGSEICIRVDRLGDATNFALHVDGEDRPAIVGRLRAQQPADA